MAGRRKNPIEAVTFTLSLSPGTIAYLERITSTHLFGRTANETASQIITNEVRRLILSGELDSLLKQRPLDLTADTDGPETEKA